MNLSKLQDWQYYKEGNTLRVFLHLLANRGAEPMNRSGVEIRAGECAFTIQDIAQELRLTPSQVETSVQKLLRAGEIVRTKYRYFSVFSVAESATLQPSIIESEKEDFKGISESNPNEIRMKNAGYLADTQQVTEVNPNEIRMKSESNPNENEENALEQGENGPHPNEIQMEIIGYASDNQQVAEVHPNEILMKSESEDDSEESKKRKKLDKKEKNNIIYKKKKDNNKLLSKKEKETSSSDDADIRFCEWLKREYPSVARMRQPLTLTQWEELRADGYSADRIKQLLADMDNYNKLVSNYKCAKRVLTNWARGQKT